MTSRRTLAAVIALVAVTLAGCSSAPPRPTPTPTAADGSSTHVIRAADGYAFAARVWRVDPKRVAIYLHEYRDDQTGWWPMATSVRRLPVSSITFDFRGHGTDEGNPDDVPGMVEDARAVVAFARSQGFDQILLIGAGMGAAIAVHVAAEQDDLRVIGLSTPSAFDLLDTLAAMPSVAGRIALVATEEDLSAAHSLGELQEAGKVPDAYVRLYPGRAHGVDMLRPNGEEPGVALAFINELMDEFWGQATGAVR